MTQLKIVLDRVSKYTLLLICIFLNIYDSKKNNMSTDREKGRGNKRASVTRGSRNPKHGKRKALHCA
jgi:hypothetical protein